MKKIMTFVPYVMVGECLQIGTMTGTSVYYYGLPHDDIDIVITDEEAKDVGLPKPNPKNKTYEEGEAINERGLTKTYNVKYNGDIINIIVVKNDYYKNLWKETTNRIKSRCMFDEGFRKEIKDKYNRICAFRKIFNQLKGENHGIGYQEAG